MAEIGAAETEEWGATAAIGVAETKGWAAISVYSGENVAIAAEETENASRFVENCLQSAAFSWQSAVISWQSTLIAADFSAGWVAIAAKGAGIFSDWEATIEIATQIAAIGVPKTAIATANAAIAGANAVPWVGENPQFMAIWHIGPDRCFIPRV
jgi:hypothetical protein